MTIDITASPDHVQPYPVVPSAPCCGRSLPDYEPIPPGWMLLDGKPLDGLANFTGMVTENRTVMRPTLRGLGCGCTAKPLKGVRATWGPRPTPRLGGLRAFDTSLLEEARSLATSLVPSLPLPTNPLDVVDAIWRLAEVERELEVQRRKLRAIERAGLLTTTDRKMFDNVRANWLVAARAVYTPVVQLIAATNPAAAAIIPPLSMPPGISAAGADGSPLPWVPDRAAYSALREGNLDAPALREAVAAVRARMGGGGTRGLGILGIDDLTIGGLILIVIAIAAIVVSVALAVAVSMEAVANVLIVWAQVFAYTRSIDARKGVFDDCIARGGTNAECTRTAEAIVPPPQINVPAPRPYFEIGGGAILALAALGAGAWWLMRTPSGARARERASSAFAGVRPRKAKRRGRTLRW